MLPKLGGLVLIIAFLATQLTACSLTDPDVNLRSAAHENAVAEWRSAWRDLPCETGQKDVEAISVQFWDASGEAEYKVRSGRKQVQIKDIRSSAADCSRWQLSAAETAAGIRWRGQCTVKYSARSRDSQADGGSEQWTPWTDKTDEVMCELTNGRWTCAVGRGGLESIIKG